jgi:hypothetical protein
MPCKPEAVQIINMPIPPTFSVYSAASRSALSQGDPLAGSAASVRGMMTQAPYAKTRQRGAIGSNARGHGVGNLGTTAHAILIKAPAAALRRHRQHSLTKQALSAVSGAGLASHRTRVGCHHANTGFRRDGMARRPRRERSAGAGTPGDVFGAWVLRRRA